MKIQLILNDDIQHQISKRLKKNKKLTPTKLINQILDEWCQENDANAYEKSLPNTLKLTPENAPRPDDAELDVLTIGELKTMVDAWEKTYGSDAILENSGHENISYRLTQ